MFMFKLSEHQKQYSRIQSKLPNVLKVRHILLAGTDFTSSIHNSQAAGSRVRHILLPYHKFATTTKSPQKAGQHTHFLHMNTPGTVFIEL